MNDYKMGDPVVMMEDVPVNSGVVTRGARADIAGYPASDRRWDLWFPEAKELIRVHESKFRSAVTETIPRNHTRIIAEIRERVTSCLIYAERHDFVAQACEPKRAWDQLREYNFAKLTTDPDGGWTIHVHSNLWYRLSA